MRNKGKSMDRVLLDQVRDGALELREILSHARELLRTDDGRDALMAGMREYILTSVRNDGASPADLAALKDTIDRIGALGRGTATALPDAYLEFAAQMDAMAALTADLSALRQHYDVDRLRDLPHVMSCLSLLADANDHQMDRAALLTALSLKESNGTRVLKNLEKARLIERRSKGRSVVVVITRLGKAKHFEWAPRFRDKTPTSSSEPARQPVLTVKGDIAGMSSHSYAAERARKKLAA